jgi:hypothetical protein
MKRKREKTKKVENKKRTFSYMETFPMKFQENF